MLGRSFDPEGLVIDPRTGHFLVADEYGPSLYEFDRNGRLIGIFETPAQPGAARPAGAVDYVARSRRRRSARAARTTAATKAWRSAPTASGSSPCCRIR